MQIYESMQYILVNSKACSDHDGLWSGLGCIPVNDVVGLFRADDAEGVDSRVGGGQVWMLAGAPGEPSSGALAPWQEVTHAGRQSTRKKYPKEISYFNLVAFLTVKVYDFLASAFIQSSHSTKTGNTALFHLYTDDVEFCGLMR